ncbi:hypothetical protein SDC9_56017 [bioreactor metagenome]|uniref:Uncharacterized protein n=1 Tax=bioreactor metagenome TaxID=1076179 RepID=A0A644X0L9_9ZZZZ
MNFETCIFPTVKVPVLSVNNMFKLPAVSIPTSFLTSTLSLIIRFMFDESTTVIITGKPSGTATTMMVTARVSALITSCASVYGFDMYMIISAMLKWLSIAIDLKRDETRIKNAPRYPMRLMKAARSLSLSFNGLSDLSC